MHIGKQRHRPEKKQRYVGRDDPGGKHRSGAQGGEHRGPEPGAGVVKRAADLKARKAYAQVKQRRGRPHAHFAVAADMRDRGNQPCQQRRL